MFKIKAPETIDATLTIVGQGREQKLELTYRHKTRQEYTDLLAALQKGERTAADVLLELIAKWNADAELSAESIEQLQSQQPGSDWAIIHGYSDALGVARKGN